MNQQQVGIQSHELLEVIPRHVNEDEDDKQKKQKKKKKKKKKSTLERLSY
jgi:hypothetical protein